MHQEFETTEMVVQLQELKRVKEENKQKTKQIQRYLEDLEVSRCFFHILFKEIIHAQVTKRKLMTTEAQSELQRQQGLKERKVR